MLRTGPIAAVIAFALAVVGVAASFPAVSTADERPLVTTSKVTATDGNVFTVTNHLVGAAERAAGSTTGSTIGRAGEYLVVWAGDVNAGDKSGAGLVRDAERPAINPIREAEIT